MSRRREQRESVLMKATQEVLARGLADPRVRGLITVTSIRLTEDGKQAFINVSILPEDRQELTMHGLRAAAKHIRRDVADRIRIREMPTMEFRLDSSIKEQAGVLAAINRATSDRPESEVPDPDALEPDARNAKDETPRVDPDADPGRAPGDDPDGNTGQARPGQGHGE